MTFKKFLSKFHPKSNSQIFEAPLPILRKILRGVLWVVAVVAGLGVLLALIYALSAKTNLSGSVINSKLAYPVKINFDDSDIPHIEAKSNNDAWFAIGYLHAQERSWQLEFNRRLASGSLSEILGESTVGIDRFIRTIGIRRAAQEQYELLPSKTKLALEAYSNGVNAGFSDLGWALPLEFLLTGSKPGYWTPIDSLSWSMMMALDLGDNWNKEFARLELAASMPTEQIWEIMPPYPGESPATTVDFANLYKNLGVYAKPTSEDKSSGSILTPKAEKTLLSWMPGGLDGIGSNNWVVDGKHSTTGKPWLANDPHLGLTAPAVWYFAHIKTNDLNVMGATLPGMPTVVLGRTENMAWGFTNTSPDVQDLFIEAVDGKNPNQYKTPDGFSSFKVRRETILVKGKPSVNFLVRETRHGPVISDAYPRAAKVIDTKRYVLALKWTALDANNQSIQAMFDMNKAEDMDDFKSAIRKNYAPMQNIVMADTSGTIGYQAAGVAPQRAKRVGLAGVAPALGWEKQYDWGPYLKAEELPHQENPAKGWIATANQRVQDEDAPHPLTSDWTFPYRQNRIEALLQKTSKHDLDSMRAIQGDTLSLGSVPLIPFLKSVKSNHPLAQQSLEILGNFDGNMAVDSSAALIFNAWADQLARRIFKPHLNELFDIEYGKRGFRPGLINVVTNKLEHWCDKPETTEVETCDQANQEAFDVALNYLSNRYGKQPSKWRWGDAHIAISEHRPMSRAGFISHFFEIKRPVPGDGFTVNVGKTGFENPNEPYATYNSASLRAIYDFSDLDKSVFIYQAGQSGWAHSSRYRQFATDWAKNSYLPLTMNPKEKPIRQVTMSPN